MDHSSTTSKLDLIKKFISDKRCYYVEIEAEFIGNVYDIYNIVINSPIELVVHRIGEYNGFVSNPQCMPTVCLYIGFFCENYFNDESERDLKFQISNCYYKLAIELGNEQAMVNLARTYLFDLRKYDKAIKYYYLAIKNGYKSRGTLYSEIANTYYKKCMTSEALKYYKLALENSSTIDNISITYHHMGVIYYNCAMYNESIKHFKMGLKSGCIDLIYHIGGVYIKIDNYAKSLKYFKKSVEHLRLGDPVMISEDYETIFKKNKDFASLIEFYVIKKHTWRIVDLLNKINVVRVDIIKLVIEYFSEIDSIISGPLLWLFIKNIIRSKIDAMDLHFLYAFNSAGYNLAKANFHDQLDLPKC